MINRELAAVFAFTALGANLLGVVMLLLLNARSRGVRWYLPFQFSVILWLLSQGAVLLWPAPFLNQINLFAVLLMPLLFLVFALNETEERPVWHGLLVLSGLLLIPFVSPGLTQGSLPWQRLFMWVYMITGWIGGSLLLGLRGRRRALQQIGKREIRKKIVVLGLVLMAPVSVIAAMLSGGAGFILYGMPLVTVWVLLLIFYGITRMQFYDVEVRVRRSGEIAAGTVEMERLAVLGELAATIAHEVRNPLTGVRSLAQRIAQEDVPADKRQRYGEVILEETARVERLVNNLLELARRGTRGQTSSAATTSLPVLFDDISMLVASRAERKHVQLITNAAGLTVTAPREALVQVLLNLTLNAITHTPDNGRVEVDARESNGTVNIVVRDSGKGIPQSERERIFDPFYTTTHAGTGLGLSVVRHLAREHNWTVNIDDAPSGGAQFTVQIPPPPPSPSPSPSPMKP